MFVCLLTFSLLPFSPVKPDEQANTSVPHLMPTSLPGVDDVSTRAFRAFHRALRLHHRALMRAFARHGIHHGQAMCLRLLTAADDMTQRDLARSLHVSSPTVTKMVGSMERPGWCGVVPTPRTPGSCASSSPTPAASRSARCTRPPASTSS